MPTSQTSPPTSVMDALSRNPLLRDLTEAQKQAIVARITPVPFQERAELYSPQAPLAGMLIGLDGVIEVVWPQPTGVSTTHIVRGRVLGGYRPLQLSRDPSAPPLPLRVRADTDGWMGVMSQADIESLAQDPCWKRDQYEDFITVLSNNAALVAGAAWGKLQVAQAWQLSPKLEEVKLKGPVPQVLFSNKREAKGLYVVGLGSVVQITRMVEGREPVTFQLGYGSVFGMGQFWSSAAVYTEGSSDEVRTADFTVTATLIQGSSVLVLPEHIIRWRVHRHLLFKSWRWLGPFLDNLSEINLSADIAVDALYQALSLNDIQVDRARLYPLLQAGQSQLWRVGVPSPAPTGDLPGVSAIVSGTIVGTRQQFPFNARQLVEPGERTVPMHIYRAPAVIGLMELLTDAPRSDNWMARVPSRAVYLPAHTLRNALGRETLVRPEWTQGVDSHRAKLKCAAVAPELESAVCAVQEHRVSPGQALRWPGVQLIALSPLQDDTRRWAPLVVLLMDEINAAFKERSLLVRLVSGDGPPAEIQKHASWDELTLYTGDSALSAVERLRQASASSWRGSYTYVFLDTPPSLPGWRTLMNVVDQIVYLNADPLAPLPEVQPYGVPYLYTSILPEQGSRGRDVVFPPSTARLKLSAATVASPPATVGELSDSDRRSIAAWARGVTGRRVGVALAGGGIWGMAHIVVLRGLERLGVPVDLVCGASDGAHVAAWYCTLGVPGLDRLMEPSTLRRLSVVNVESFLTLQAFVRWLDHELGGARLEELLCQCIPVGTDVLTGSEVPVLSGSVAEGVRMSASLTPIYPSTPSRARTWLDGAFSCNLPTVPLMLEGVSLLITSNAVQPQPGLTPRPPTLPGGVGKVLADLDPLRRIFNSWYGLLTLGYSVGAKTQPDTASHFDSAWTGTSFLNVMSSEQVVEDMESMPQTRQMLVAVRDRWKKLSAPREPLA